MSLSYDYWNNGYPGLFFSEIASQVVSPPQCFEVRGDQKEIHLYLNKLGSLEGANFQMIYEFESGSRTTSNVFSDAVVRLFFCSGPFTSVSKSEFEEKLIKPFQSMFQ